MKELYQYTQVSNRSPCARTIPANKLTHDGAHVHSTRDNVMHFCEARCPYCQYFCTLPLGALQGTTRMYLFVNAVLGHPQAHNTRHGSMEQTSWAIEGGDDATCEVQGHKFAIGDSGAPMLCSMFCRELGRRHTHVDFCRSNDISCTDPAVEHITQRMEPRPGVAKDWITHSLYWARSGKYKRLTRRILS